MSYKSFKLEGITLKAVGGEVGVIIGLRFKRPANGMSAADSRGFVRSVA